MATEGKSDDGSEFNAYTMNMDYNQMSSQYIWHIHPNGSTPSAADINAMSNWRSNGFTGNTFLIDINNGVVTFFNEKGTMKSIKYSDFIRMGNQEEIK